VSSSWLMIFPQPEAEIISAKRRAIKPLVGAP
jgi:hypothetical protein